MRKNSAATTPKQNPDQYFETEHLKANIKGRSVKGGAITMVSQACKFVLQTGSTVVLARLLTPEDYGLFGMVAAVTGFISLFKDLGLSKATVQRETINQAQVSTLFWVNVGVSLLLAFVTAAIAPAIAWFYGEPRLTMITLVLAIGYFFGGLAVQHQALLNRQMRFTVLAIIDIADMAIGVLVGVVAALMGYGLWALVFMQLAMGITNAVMSWTVCSWRPSLPSRKSGVRSMLAFGANLTGFNVVNYFARNADNVLIGRFWGAQQLGLYTKAYQLLLMPLYQINAPLTRVAVPALSRLASTPDRYRQAYLRTLGAVCILTMPLIVFMIGTSDWLMTVVLGPQWVEAGKLFALLGIVAWTQPVSNTTGWLFVTQDRTRKQLQWGLIGSTLSIIAIAAGLPWGAMGVAASYSISGLLIRTPLLFWYVGQGGFVRTGDLYRTLAPFAFSALGALLGIGALRYWVEVPSPLMGLILAAGITVITTGSILLAMPTGRAAIRDFRDLLIPLLFKKDKKTFEKSNL